MLECRMEWCARVSEKVMIRVCVGTRLCVVCEWWKLLSDGIPLNAYVNAFNFSTWMRHTAYLQRRPFTTGCCVLFLSIGPTHSADRAYVPFAVHSNAVHSRVCRFYLRSSLFVRESLSLWIHWMRFVFYWTRPFSPFAISSFCHFASTILAEWRAA